MSQPGLERRTDSGKLMSQPGLEQRTDSGKLMSQPGFEQRTHIILEEKGVRSQPIREHGSVITFQPIRAHGSVIIS